jgi:hypothetical protein
MLVWTMYMMGLLTGIGLGVLGAWVRMYRSLERRQVEQEAAQRRADAETWQRQMQRDCEMLGR